MGNTNNGMSIVSNVKGSVLAQADYLQSDTKTLSVQLPVKGVMYKLWKQKSWKYWKRRQ